ncbi:MAG: 16S rRNA (uracil(1498)-N(3))-methyltransferase [Legionellales bacterium]|nr:16S rRNA (uracil(1498)-N(3))-methyltransferase [Legionellales bacterium]
MRISRIYTPSPLNEGSTIALHDNAAHYVSRVLRLPVGAVLRLFNGEGGEFTAQIAAISKREVNVYIEQYHAVDIGSALFIHLGQVISRGERMDITIQKATELGVSAITPLLSDYCNVKLEPTRLEKKMQHWQSIIISACEQSGRTQLPVLYPPVPLNTWLSSVEARCRLILEPSAEDSLKNIGYCKEMDFALLIGGEGGLSDAELALVARYEFIGIKLGSRILRTETAALAAISALQVLFGDFC